MIDAIVTKAIAEQFGTPEASVDLDKPLSDLDADSLDLVELVMAIEDALDIDLPDDELDKLGPGADATKVTGRQLVDLSTRIKG